MTKLMEQTSTNHLGSRGGVSGINKTKSKLFSIFIGITLALYFFEWVSANLLTTLCCPRDVFQVVLPQLSLLVSDSLFFLFHWTVCYQG